MLPLHKLVLDYPQKRPKQQPPPGLSPAAHPHPQEARGSQLHVQRQPREAGLENVAIQRATPQGAVQAGMCAIACSLPSSASFFSFSSFVQARGGMLGSDGLP